MRKLVSHLQMFTLQGLQLVLATKFGIQIPIFCNINTMYTVIIKYRVDKIILAALKISLYINRVIQYRKLYIRNFTILVIQYVVSHTVDYIGSSL